MKKNPSIQKVIFKTLSRKKAVSYDTLKKEVEDIIENTYTARNRPKYAISRSIKNLQSDGLVECLNSGNQPYFRLSSEGRKRFNSNILDDETTLVSNSWDGYWRFVILDLPEERKNERESLRYLLKKAGFICIKNSVWVSIYPYEHLFSNIKKDLGLSYEMMILVTNKLDELTEKELLSRCRESNS